MAFNDIFIRINGRFPTGYERAIGGASVRGVTGGGVPFRYQKTSNVYANQESVKVLSKLFVRSTVLEAAAKSEEATAQLVNEYAKKMLKSPKKQAQLKKMHEKLAKEAQEKIKYHYKTNKKGNRSYRQNDKGVYKRYSGGVLWRALSDPKLFVTTPGQIGGINVRVLDAAAPQWYRLNFGALPRRSTGPAGQGSLKLFGQSSQTSLSLRKYGPSKPFFTPNSPRTMGKSSGIPLSKTPPLGFGRGGGGTSSAGTGIAGRAMMPRGQAKFDITGAAGRVFSGPGSRSKGPYLYVYPRPGSGRLFGGTFGSVLSKGILGTRFLDKGIQHINNNYGSEFRKLVVKWHKEATAKKSITK